MVSVIITVLNEQGTIQGLLTTLRAQTYKKFEIIIVDGGSIDGTWEKLLSYKAIKLFRKAGNRSVGRNFGVSKSKGSIIAFTDAGCIPHTDWLERLIKPFKTSSVQVVSGYYRGLVQTAFEKCLLPYVLVMPDQIKSEFLPVTRSMALTRQAWNVSNGFDERLWHNEDYAFALKLKSKGFSFTFVQDAVVDWQPRKDLKSTAWMFLRFAIGDAQAGIFRPKVKFLAIRYYAFLFLCFINKWFLLLLIPYLVWAIAKNFRYVRMWQALYWLPILQLTADIMVLFGTMVGLLSRIK